MSRLVSRLVSRVVNPRAAVTLAAVVLSAAACATMGSPPGGPPDAVPPTVMRVAPESGTVSAPDRALVLYFDEVVSDQPSGVTDLAGLVLISPRTGAPRVDWRRESIAIRPRGGWRPNTTYSVTLLPGVADVRGNAIRTAGTVVFSTGPELAASRIAGRLFDWVAGRAIPAGIVEAIALPVGRDSVVYVGAADSTGAFTVGPLPAGSYLVRGFADQNRNRGMDRSELWDSVTVTSSAEGGAVELLAALRDTVAPRISGVAARDSVTLELTVDRPLRPGLSLEGRVRILRADSTPVPVVAVTLRSPQDRDTTARGGRARDTTERVAPARDTTVAADTSATAARPSRPSPPTIVVVTLGAPLAPGTAHRIRVDGLESITGATRSAERVHTTPKPPPRPKAAADSVVPGIPTGAPSPAPVRPDTGRPRA